MTMRISNKGPREGYCVICGTHGTLTRDHVPPKKCNNLNNTELEVLQSRFAKTVRGTISQGGTQFKTLCGKCNNERLGIQYDPSLVDLSNAITSLVLGARRKHIQLQQKIYPIIKPQRIARAVVGHMLAAVAVEETKSGLIKSPMSDALRKYFLDQTLPLPEEMEIYYWPYPYKEQVLIKGFGKFDIRTKHGLIGDIFKFLPLGFLLTWEKPDSINVNIPVLLRNKKMGIDEQEKIEIDLYNHPPHDFPEAPKDWELSLLNDQHAFIGSLHKTEQA